MDLLKMQRNHRIQTWLILIFALAVAAGGFWWLCKENEGIAFLADRPGAEWIVYPDIPSAMPHPPVPRTAVFRRFFTVDQSSSQVVITVCAFKTFSLAVDGKTQTPAQVGQNWKSPTVFQINHIQPGSTNEIEVCVTNSLGPPALWLRMEAGTFSLGSGKDWQVSLAGSEWENALLAASPPAISPASDFYGDENMAGTISRVWIELLILIMAAVALVIGVERGLRCWNRGDTTAPITALLVFVIIARLVLFLHDTSRLPRTTGFDAISHEEYVQFIQEKHALPDAVDGWEMFQPPLYYLIGAGTLDLFGSSVGEERATHLLRAINCVAGIVQCVLTLLCLRLLFPQNRAAQAAGLLVASFLPAQLCLSQYVTNELLAGLFATAGLFFLLKIIKSQKAGASLYISLGAMLGAALLSKSSLMPVAALMLAVTGWHLNSRKSSVIDWSNKIGGMVLTCLAICGWHYVMVWWHHGKLVLGNWDVKSPFLCWQYPGYRTAGYYFHFGGVFVDPLCSGFRSYWDGLYSTLWGDGLASGVGSLAFCPPWNYGLMNSAMVLSTVISLIILIGIAITVIRLVRQSALDWAVMIGIIYLFACAIIFMTLRVPFYSEAKAFYALPALVPFSALMAAGWEWLGRKNNVIRNVLWMLLLMWVMTLYTSLWIRDSNPQVHLDRGFGQLEERNYDESRQSLALALQWTETPAGSLKDPAFAQVDGEAHFYLGQIDEHNGNSTGTIDEYQKAVNVDENLTLALNNLAWILATSSNAELRDGTRAVQLAGRACDLTQYRETIMVGTLAAAYAEVGRFNDAIATAQKAIALAQQNHEQELAQTNQKLLALYQAHKPYHEVTLVPTSK